MTFVDTTQSTKPARETSDIPLRLLERMGSKGVRLWVSQGDLRYRVLQGGLTMADREALRTHKDAIMALLALRADMAVDQGAARDGVGRYRAPLAYSQRAHWNLYDLGRRPSACLVRSITRVNGRLKIDALERSISAVAHQHDALRTRIVICGGEPMQEITSAPSGGLKLEDWRRFNAQQQETQIEELIRSPAPIEVTDAPLFQVTLALLDDMTSLLEVSMEHLISDGYSMGVFMEDLCMAYRQTARGSAVSLDDVAIQFPEYATHQQQSKCSWYSIHAPYFQSHFLGCERVRFPTMARSALSGRVGVGFVHFRIDAGTRMALASWCKTKRTTLVIGAFTAYVALVLRWCNVCEAVFSFEIDGRAFHDTDRTIGYLAFPLHHRLSLRREDTFSDLLERVRAEHYRAYEHPDFSYMEAQIPRPEYTRNACFNWFRQIQRRPSADHADSDDPIKLTRITSKVSTIETMERDAEPLMAILETEDEITGNIGFSLGKLSHPIMERFATAYLKMLSAMTDSQDVRILDVPLS